MRVKNVVSISRSAYGIELVHRLGNVLVLQGENTLVLFGCYFLIALALTKLHCFF